MEKLTLPRNTGNSIQQTFEQEYQESVFNTLEQNEFLDIMRNKTVVVDISIKKVLQSWNQKTEMYINTVSWLPKWINIKNPDVLVQFCRIHGFLPMIRNIYLDDLDISKLKELPQIMKLFEWIVRQWNINFALYSEISKIIDLMEENGLDSYDVADFYYIYSVFENIRQVGFFDIPNSFWKKLEKNWNTWTFSENIFCEIAFRLENEIRQTLGIYSTYLNMASKEDDEKRKTDMRFTFNSWNDNEEEYQHIPVQLTTSNCTKWTFSKNRATHKKTGARNKLNEIEKKLLSPETTQESFPFVVIFVNWDFSKKVHKGQILQEYKEWASNSCKRQQQSISKFPFFINTIEQDCLVSPKIAYIVLNLIFQNISFKKDFGGKRQTTDYRNKIQCDINEILEDMWQSKIGWVFMDKIWVQINEINQIKPNNAKKNWTLTYYDITFTYKQQKLGVFRIYV